MSKKKSTRNNGLWVGIGIAAIIVLVIGAVYIFPGNNSTATEVSQSLPQEISVDEAAILRESGAFLLDVREPEEWVEYHIPGATLIPLAQLENRLNEVPADQEVVIVCRSGNRSLIGRDILQGAGFENSTSMAGGMKQWMAAGYEWVEGP